MSLLIRRICQRRSAAAATVATRPALFASARAGFRTSRVAAVAATVPTSNAAAGAAAGAASGASTPFRPSYGDVKGARPSNVGIVGMEVYFPKTYVSQESLEEFDKAGKGKYTIGLGQKSMAFVDDREDINSMAMTAVQSLLEKYKISPQQIGRLEVGTETIIDKSKSAKTTLMQLFAKSGNASIEGIDTTNACYGGTAAFLNALHWVESSAWDGRYAIVVAGDIAVYEPGPARPTGGAGVVAMLIGPNAPITVEHGLRASYMEDAYDFYKPNLESEYPVVDGKLSISCYLRAVDSCYRDFRNRFAALTKPKAPFALDTEVDYACFHSPYTKLVMRSWARLLYNDSLSAAANDARFSALSKFRTLSTEASYTDKDLTKVLDNVSKDTYTTKVAPSQLLSQELGNTYCGSLYCNLLSLIANKTDAELINKRTVMFSYGSGLAATMFSLKVRESVDSIRKASDIKNRLKQRVAVTPQQFSEALLLREKSHSTGDYKPVGTGPLFPGTYTLSAIDKLKRRTYTRV